MKKTSLLSLILCILLTACSNAGMLVTPTSFITPPPTLTPFLTITPPAFTPTDEVTASPTLQKIPYEFYNEPGWNNVDLPTLEKWINSINSDEYNNVRYRVMMIDKDNVLYPTPAPVDALKVMANGGRMVENSKAVRGVDYSIEVGRYVLKWIDNGGRVQLIPWQEGFSTRSEISALYVWLDEWMAVDPSLKSFQGYMFELYFKRDHDLSFRSTRIVIWYPGNGETFQDLVKRMELAGYSQKDIL